MADHIRYDLLAQDALRGMVRGVLIDAAKNGLPGEHHFFIAFDTTAPGVKMSPRLREQHPKEMTIVMQHQFWDLKVHDERFEIGLSFGGVGEHLSVPFEAIKSFFDPSVQFGLQFETVEVTSDNDAEGEIPASNKPALAPVAVKESAPTPVAAKDETDPEPGPDAPSGGAEVVRLDRFRKK